MNELENEKKYLKNTILTLNNLIAENLLQKQSLLNRIKEDKQELTSNFYDMEDEEVSRYKVNIDENELSIKTLEKDISKKEKQLNKPFFSRIDFKTKDNCEKIYIGLGHIKKENFLVYDWRAPISSMYYDFNTGTASYTCEEGSFEGEITLKRQFSIEDQNLNFYVDTNETISDEILQKVLSNNTSAKMKDIVSSIQKEQNQLIRSNDEKNIIVQGVAGSGKTSVALHRAAYLLYKNKEFYTNEDILIISPSKLFSNYISDVLPQLGENNIVETTFFTIANRELDKKIESRSDFIDDLCKNKQKTQLKATAYKSSYSFLENLLSFLKNIYTKTFKAQNMRFSSSENDKNPIIFTKEEIEKLFFESYSTLEIHKRINYIAEYLIERFNLKKNEFEPIKQRFVSMLYKFFPTVDLGSVYQLFLSTQKIKFEQQNFYSYDDIAPILILKEYIFGFKTNNSYKYMIIDEMQDFTPCHFYIFNKIFKCPKLLLGDINQCIEKNLTQDYLNLLAKNMKSEIIYLNKTYRSTKQIAQFAQNIIKLDNIENFCREGEKPQIIKTKNTAREIENILNEVNNFKHIAIICKTTEEVDLLFEELNNNLDILKLTDQDDQNEAKIIITTATTSKGIEFDHVIIPFCNRENYNNQLDKNLLYIASTRALHKLTICYTTTPCKFIKI